MRYAVLLLSIVLLGGCVVSEVKNAGELSYWRELARERHLAGESAGKFARYQADSADGQLQMNLPDLAKLVRSESGERAAELSVNTLYECVLVSSARLVPEGVVRSQYAMELFAGDLDCRSALMLAKRVMLEKNPWHNSSYREHEHELYSDILAHFGKIPGNEKIILAEPRPVKVSPMPDAVRRNFGKDPEALLKLGAVILALPGEFAKQIIVNPDSNISGIWLEARRMAVLAALHIAEKELAAAWEAYQREMSAQNLFLYRKWFYYREKLFSLLPLMRGSADDAKAWEAMMILQNHF